MEYASQNFFTAVFTTGVVHAHGINNFSQAKAAAAKINQDAPGSFYCSCRINWQGKKGVPDLTSCGYPVSGWECQREARIAKVQGNHNLYIRQACQQRKR